MDIPFRYRVVGLIVLMAVVAGIERLRKGRQAARWKEYGFALLCGCMGAAVGAMNDAITSSISPEYFTLGKGLSEERLHWNAVYLGMSAGFSAGVIGGALTLVALGRNRPPFKKLLPLLAIPVLAALAAGTVAWICAPGWDPVHLAASLDGVISPSQLKDFRQVWWIHTALYTGLALGLAAMILAGRRLARAQTATLGTPSDAQGSRSPH